MRVTEIKLTELTESAVTRKRGTDAAKILEARLQRAAPATVVIELSGLPMISASFIDEIVLRSRQIQKRRGIEFLFRVRDESILEKLTRVSGLRDIPLKYIKEGDSRIRDIAPVEPLEVEVTETHSFPTRFEASV